jgi:hypothetical protein
MIYSFYSYKGGVGRSMALANIAEWLYMKGARVVLVDWDLEAPGIESFFYKAETELREVREHTGLIDLFREYKQAFIRSERLEPDLDAEARFAKVISKVGPLEARLYNLHPSATGAGLWLLTAGARGDDQFSRYADEVQGFDWSEFYERFDGARFFDWMRRQLDTYDAAFIDSRTGVTEMGGVCTRELADVVVSFCAPNLQNLAGVVMMAKSFTRPEIRQARNGKPEVIVIPARIDTNELEDRNRFELEFRTAIHDEKLLPEVFLDLDRHSWDLRIPYIPKFAYREALTFGSDGSKARIQKASELEEVYQRIAAYLAFMAPQSSLLRQSIGPEIEKFVGRMSPLVVVAAMAPEDEPFATQLVALLGGQGVSVWQTLGIKGETLSWSRIEPAIKDAGSIVLVMSPEARSNPLTLRLWRYARQNGVRVLLTRRIDYDTNGLPQAMRAASPFEIPGELESLAARLKAPALTIKRPFTAPELPDDFVPRTADETALKAALLSNRAVTLYGPTGFGKTTLAAAVCRSDEMRDAFDDGVLWLDASPASSTTRAPDLAAIVASLMQALDRPAAYANLDEGLAQVRQIVGERDCLLVFDRIQDPGFVGFSFGDWKCTKLLIVSGPRNLYEFPPTLVTLDQVTVEEGMALLGGSEDVFRRLATLLGRWMPALKAVRAVLHRPELFRDVPAAQSAEMLANILEGDGLRAFDRAFGTDLRGIVARRLGDQATDRASFANLLALGVLPPGTPVPISELIKLRHGANISADLEAWNALHLVGYNPTLQTVETNPLVHAFLADELAELPAAIKALQRQTEAQPGGPLDRLSRWRFVEKVGVLEGIGHTAYVRTLDFTPDGTALISASDNGNIVVSRGAGFAESRVLAVNSMPVNALALAGGGRQVAAACSDRSLRVYDLDSGKLVRTMTGHSHWVTSVCQGGENCVSGSADRTLRAWNATTCYAVVRPAAGWITAVALAANGRAAFGSSDGSLGIVDLKTGRPVRMLGRHNGWVRALRAISADEEMYISASDEGIVQVDAPGKLARLGVPGVTCCVALSPTLLAAGSSSGGLTFWFWPEPELLDTIDAGAPLLSCAVSPDGRLIAAGDAAGRIHLIARKRL